MDISTLSLTQLRDLAARIPSEIEKRQKEEKANLRKELAALAAERGFSLDELVSSAPKTKKSNAGSTIPVKYRHPSDPSLTWTGRGRQPRWVVDFINGGGTIEQLTV